MGTPFRAAPGRFDGHTRQLHLAFWLSGAVPVTAAVA
jgi:hypothetical protein